MSASELVDELEAAGVRVTHDGARLRVRARKGVSVAAHVERITAHKPELLRELTRRSAAAERLAERMRLQGEIKEAAARVGRDFDPKHFIRLWRRYEALGGRLPICRACPDPDLCLISGPRGPRHPSGACPAFPIEAIIPESPESRPSNGVHRQEVAAAPDDDPDVVIDREAPTHLDREHGRVVEVS